MNAIRRTADTTPADCPSGTQAKLPPAATSARGGVWPGLGDPSDDDREDEPRSGSSVTLIDVGTVVGGRFRIERHLARGGMGAVWEATDLEASEPSFARVALKTMTACTSADPEGHERFRREIALAQGLVGPHFPRVSGAGVENGMPYLALELLEGETLLARLEREERLPLETCRWLMSELCAALGAAHDLGIVHRDVTPTNIFLAAGPNGPELKLLDLGIAKHELFSTKLTATGVLVGSPHYMSPEQVANVGVGYRTDLWSAGVVVYRALTGRRPFPGDTGMAVLAAALRKPAISPSEVLPELGLDVDAFFLTALAKNASNRFVSAERMARAFEAATAHLVGAVSPVRGASANPDAADQSTMIARDDYVSFAAVASQESAAGLASDDKTAIAVIEDSTGDDRDSPTRRVTKRTISPPRFAALRRLADHVVVTRRSIAAGERPMAILVLTALLTFAAMLFLAQCAR
jgi:serine/threonine protein kinase